MITCNTALSKDIKKFCYSLLNSVRTMCDFINYGTDYMCVWEHLKENIFGVICSSSYTKKWEFFIFMMKTNLGDLQFYIIVPILTNIYIFWFWYSQNLSLIVLTCKPLFLWFLIEFFCFFTASTLSKMKLKKCLSSQLKNKEKFSLPL